MMTDAFLPEGITEMAVDSIFMMPQLGVLSTVHAQAAGEVFEKDCLIRLGTVVAPWGEGKLGQPCFKARIGDVTREMKVGEIELVPLGLGESVKAVFEPDKNWDLGAGKGRSVERMVNGGVVGVLLDARGRRPFLLPDDRAKRVMALKRWNAAINMYPEDALVTS